MLNNNISNRSCMTVGVLVDDFLIKQQNTLMDKLNPFKAPFYLNNDIVSLMFYLFKQTDCTISLFYLDKKFIKNGSLIKDIPYARLININKPVEIAIALNTGQLDYFISTDNFNSLVGDARCFSLAEFNAIRKGF